jgi:LAO/AO transport system kinase
LTIEQVLEGNVRAAAKLIRRIDDNDPDVIDELSTLYAHTRNAYVIGFTGSPGVGKSTLVDRIIARFRALGNTVGVLAIDPTSPFSGGAILGDRIRMQKHFMDDGVFIRSLATRGKFGGLTRSTADAIVVLDAMGKDVIIVETVGVGQDEIDIVHSAHTTVLVTIPGMGDDIQAIKAGLMEIGDLFVVNKADREGSAKTAREIKSMLSISGDRYNSSGWEPPVILSEAVRDTGVDDVFQAIISHRNFLSGHGKDGLLKRQRSRIRSQLFDLFKETIIDEALSRVGGINSLEMIVDDIIDRRANPYSASIHLKKKAFGLQRNE